MMIFCFSYGTSLKQLVCTGGSVRRQIICEMTTVPGSQFYSECYFRSSQSRQRYNAVSLSKPILLSLGGKSMNFSLPKQRGYFYPSAVSRLVYSTERQIARLSLSSRFCSMSFKLSTPKEERISRTRWNVRPRAWLLGGTSAGICVSFASTKPVSAQAAMEDDEHFGSTITLSHGKKVFTDYSITGIPGDGRCLFRSVAHGACLRSGKPLPNESLQRELADELRDRVADEFVKRRAETEWFIEGDFDAYVSQMRKPHVWGGEPELLMATHVLQMPITVYMHDEDSGGLIAIAEYGQEYGTEYPIRILYHGFGHYDALQIPGKRGQKSRL